jgi:hypothetical protein
MVEAVIDFLAFIHSGILFGKIWISVVHRLVGPWVEQKPLEYRCTQGRKSDTTSRWFNIDVHCGTAGGGSAIVTITLREQRLGVSMPKKQNIQVLCLISGINENSISLDNKFHSLPSIAIPNSGHFHHVSNPAISGCG